MNIIRISFGIFLIILAESVVSDGLFSQSLPDFLTFAEDGRRLRLGGVESGGFYNESEINTVYLDFYDADYWQQMKDNYNTQEYVLAMLTIGDRTYDSVAVQFKGQTSYTKPEKEDSEKLSFDVKLGEVIDGQEIDGYSTLNFNNAFQDPSFMREVLYAHLSREHMPAVKGNFVRLYLNGEDWGLYPNIQQLNGDFIREWFMNNNGIRWRADKPPWYEPNDPVLKGTGEVPPGPDWGDGTAALNYLGDDPSEYQKYYTLKSSEIDDPWSYLIRICDILNNVPPDEMVDSLRRYMNIDGTIWFLAHEIVYSDDDSYIHKGKMDYYLYLDEETGLMIPLEFDGNSAMSLRNVEWSPFYNFHDENYPLLNRMLGVPELRQRYIAHVRTILNDCFNGAKAGSLIDDYASLVASHVQSDPKIDFTYNLHNRLVNDLRTFVSGRKEHILSEHDISLESPEIIDVMHGVEGEDRASPGMDQEVLVSASASHMDGIYGVNLYYGTGFVGNFTRLPMVDDGIHQDGEAGDGLFSGVIPAFPSGTYVRYYVEAVADNTEKTISLMPEGAEYDVFIYRVNFPASIESGLVLNEFLASNGSIAADESGEYDDWIELYNRSDYPVSLKGYHLSDDAFDLAKWAFPDVSLDPGKYQIIWADDDIEQGTLHSNFKISANGEELFLTDAAGHVIDQVTFQNQERDISLGRLPNGTGSFSAMIPTFGANNQQALSVAGDSTPELEFYVYPNPATDHLNIWLQGQIPSEIEIYNAYGQLLYKNEFKPRIDISQLVSGLYVLQVGEFSVLFQVQ